MEKSEEFEIFSDYASGYLQGVMLGKTFGVFLCLAGFTLDACSC